MDSRKLGFDLDGRRILVVEDEYYLAADLAAALAERGAVVVGPVGSVDEAERLAGGGGVDCAILDMNLRGEMSHRVADCLEKAGVPYLIASGYSNATLPDRFRGVPFVEKPLDAERVAAMIPQLLRN